MAGEEKEVRNVLNDLIETCKDGEQGFRTAAEKAKEGSLKSLFAKYASQRAEYAQALQGLVAGLGGDPATSGHISGSLHRGWMNLKEAVSRNEDKALIDECEAGEDAAVKSYKEALAKPLPASASPAGFYIPSTSRNCKPPLDQGWGIFNRQNEEFSTGVDSTKKFAIPRPEHQSIADANLALNPDLHVTNRTPPTFLLQSRG